METTITVFLVKTVNGNEAPFTTKAQAAAASKVLDTFSIENVTEKVKRTVQIEL